MSFHNNFELNVVSLIRRTYDVASRDDWLEPSRELASKWFRLIILHFKQEQRKKKRKEQLIFHTKCGCIDILGENNICVTLIYYPYTQ